jgi:hypothetical protein
VAVTSLIKVPFEDDWGAVLVSLPASLGVGQILGSEDQNLLIGRPANLRRWASLHLGQGRPRRPGSRPPTDLRPVARAVRYRLAASAFEQRLVFERLMGLYVPSEARRDLKVPGYLHLDPRERFPRVSVCPADVEPSQLFGPFRNRRAAEGALKALHKLFPLRPCDFVFEPDPALELGLSCLYAQVRTCAAPCLVRVSEEGYRSLASETSCFLADPHLRSEEIASWIPPWVTRVEGSFGLVVVRGQGGVELYPVRGGAVLEEGAVTAPEAELEGAVDRVSWPATEGVRDDRPWLSEWLHAPRRKGAYFVLSGPGPSEGLPERIRSALS